MPADRLLAQLADKQIDSIHQAALDMLERFGVGIEDPALIDCLTAHGCISRGNGRVRIPPGLIENAMTATVPPLTISALSGARRTLAEGNLCTHSSGGAPWIVDAATGVRRNATTGDLVDSIRLMNCLEMLDFPCALLYPADMPAAITQFLQTAELFRHSEKPVYCPGISTADNARYIAELFRLLGPHDEAGNAIGIVGISPQSPLLWPKEITDAARILAGLGIPISILAAPMGGMTAPMSIVGCVTQCHAEILAFALYCRLVSPDALLLYGARNFFPNMRNCQTILGLPETGIASGMAAQLARRCGMLSDVYGLAGGSCDFDEQTGYEKMLNGLLPALSGASMITGFGSLASVLGGSLEQLVIDDEIAAMIRKTLRGYQVDEDAFGFEALAEVIENGGTFLEQPHTVQYLREKEIFQPRLGFADHWQQREGQPSLIDRAQAEVRKILAEETRPILRDDQERELQQLIRAAEKEFAL